jgi:IS30 family transposase
LERQERVFALSVMAGKSARAIALEIGVDRNTVMADLRYESRRRSTELGERREYEKARAIAFYEDIERRAIVKSDLWDEILRQVRDDDGADVNAARKTVNDRSLDIAVKARERIDKLLGLDAPTRVEIGVQALLVAIS